MILESKSLMTVNAFRLLTIEIFCDLSKRFDYLIQICNTISTQVAIYMILDLQTPFSIEKSIFRNICSANC